MNTLPQELWWQIFSYYNIQDIIKLYIHKDPEINAILTSNYFWYSKFNSHKFPIITRDLSFVQWCNEFIRVDMSIRCVKNTLNIQGSLLIKWDDNIFLTLGIKNEQLERLWLDQISKADFQFYSNAGDIALYNCRENGTHKLYINILSDSITSDTISILISTDYNEIFNILFKGHYYDIFKDHT